MLQNRLFFALASRSGFGATISDAVARSSIVLCNSVSADRIVMAASRLLRAVAAFVILLSFAARLRKSYWSGCNEGCEMDLLADFPHFVALVFFVPRRFRAVWSVGRKECSVKCEGSSGSEKCEVWSVKCAVWSVKFKFGVRRAQCEVWSVRFGVWRKQWEVRSVECEVWSVECEVWSAKSAVCSVRCGVSREGHGRDRLSLNYRSFMFGKLPPPACPGLC